ncbi:MAG: 3,4-dihydroxy-2-butanone-4-phosphate synthase [Geminicoccaceae bacterium]|nr:3,4-dihydroxy-2-butanone-4-phosphate synthase [Geminicoccaceae bacterium]
MADLNSIDEAIEAIRAGELVIVVDDDDRENEGDLVMAAGLATPDKMAFMIRHCCGIVCSPITGDTARRLRLDPMVNANDAPLGTAFTVSVDYRFGLTTGISAEERVSTVRALANGNAGPQDFVRPGHVFPLIARDGGVLVRSGHTEAAVDLTRLADLEPAAIICELVNDDGSVKRLPELVSFAREHDLKIVSIADLIEYRQRREHLIERISEMETRTIAGPAKAVVFQTPFDGIQHMALVFGDIGSGKDVLARIHREQPMNDLFGNDGRRSMEVAMNRLGREGRGVFVLLRDTLASQPGPSGNDTEDAGGDDEDHGSAQKRLRQWREVGIGAQILRDLGIDSIRLLAAHQRHYVGLSGFGIEITETALLDE